MSTGTAYRYSHSMGFYAPGGRGFNNPVDVAFGKNQVLYVLNRAGPEVEVRMTFKRVTMCTVDEEFLGVFGSGGNQDGQIMWPSSIVTDEDDNVYITDEALHRVSIFDKDGRFLSKWGVAGNKDGEFDRPAGIALDTKGNILVVDGLNNRVQRYTREGHFLGGWGKAGSDDGEFNMPWGICVDDTGNVYVADWRNDRIQKFADDGTHLATWGESGQDDGQFNRPSGVDVDDEGNVYVADWGNERLQILGPDGNFITKLRGESGVSKWGHDYLVANIEEYEERERANLEPVPEASPNDPLRDESASIEKLFWGPVSVRVDSHGRVYVVESCRHRIQVYQKSS